LKDQRLVEWERKTKLIGPLIHVWLGKPFPPILPDSNKSIFLEGVNMDPGVTKELLTTWLYWGFTQWKEGIMFVLAIALFLYIWDAISGSVEDG
jgi:hypothetical protein